MKKSVIAGLAVFLILFSIINVLALYSPDNNTIDYGHVLRVKSLNVPELNPGETGILKVILQNGAKYSVTDIRTKLILPSQFQFSDDVDKVKSSEIKSGEDREFDFRIVAQPNSNDGIYTATLSVDYLSHYAVNFINVGDESQDNYTLSLVIKSQPSIFMILQDSEIYRGKSFGSITLKFVNNGTSNLKFLNVHLKESDEYEILSDKNYYIGDLDSDDFETVVFRIKTNQKEMVTIPVEVQYKDPLNNNYNQELTTTLIIRSASEAGKKGQSYAWAFWLIAIIALIIIYFVYKKFKKKKKY